MGTRRKGREAALQMLYQMDLSGVTAERAVSLYWEHLGATRADRGDNGGYGAHGE